MKNLKKKLFAATAMLLVSAVMLGGSTFAWYTLSTAPEIKAVQFNMSANENLEIALDNHYANGDAVDTASTNATVQGGVQGSTSGNYYTWGNLIDLTAAITNSGTDKIALKPVEYEAAEEFNYPKYGADGRIKVMDNSQRFYISDFANNISVNGGFAVYGQNTTQANNKTFDAFSVTYWLRSNMTTSVSLSATGVKRAQSGEDASAAEPDVNGFTGAGSYILATATNANVDQGIDAKTVKQNTDALAALINEGKLVIRFDVGSESYYAKATPGQGDDAKATLSLVNNVTAESPTAKTIDLTANTAQKVTVSVYLDGDTITNKDALLVDLTGITLNLQFVGTNVDDAIDVGNAPANP